MEHEGDGYITWCGQNYFQRFGKRAGIRGREETIQTTALSISAEKSPEDLKSGSSERP